MDELLKKTVIYAILAAIFYLVLFLFFDRIIDLWIYRHCSKTWLFQAGGFVSNLAEGSFYKLGIALCFIAILIFDPSMEKRPAKYLLYVCVSVTIAVVIGDGLKYLFGRYRPVMLFEHNLYGLHFFSEKWEMNSTPSGHTLRAFSLLTALSMLYRRSAFLFIGLAVLIGASRVVVTAHYPSDVVFGAFIGIFAAVWTYRYFAFENIDNGVRTLSAVSGRVNAVGNRFACRFGSESKAN